MPLTSTSAMTVSGQFTSWNVSFKNHQWFWAFKSKIRAQNIFQNVYNLIKNEKKKKNQRAKKNMFSMCFVALLTCFRVRCLAGKLDWLMDVGFGVTHTHTRTHPHTYKATLTSTHLVHLTCRQHLAWHTMPLERYVFVSHSFPTLPTTAALVLLLFVYLFVVFAFWYLNLACGLATALAW